MLQQRRNMNYQVLYDTILCQQKKNIALYNGSPAGFILYKLQLRPCVNTLGLTDDHKPRSPTIHVFDSVILVSRAFVSNNFSSSTFFCAWLESDPTEVIFWERDKSYGITEQIIEKRFQSGYCWNDQSIFDSNLSIQSQRLYTEERSKESRVRSEAFQSQKSKSAAENIATTALRIENTNPRVDAFTSKFSSEVYDADNNLLRMEIIKDFLSGESFNLVRLLYNDDDEVDSSGTIYKMRSIFDEVCLLGDALVLSRQSLWHNMNKTILNEFKCKWEQAIMVVKSEEIDGFIPDSEWLQTMWLHVIGCPTSVRTKRDVITAICLAFSELTRFGEGEVIAALNSQGFRPSLSRWICARCCFDSFKKDVLGIATPMPWNSFLCPVNDCVYYTHLHSDNGTDFFRVQPVEVKLHISGEIGSEREEIKSVELNMDLENWTPKDFVKSTFDKLNSMLENKSEEYYVLGHCCPEQAIVSMTKSGMTPLATYRNEFSCGHGMYFFKLDKDVFRLSFDVLDGMAHDNSPTINPIGLQFRAFLYAMLTVFQKPECDVMSPAVLVFVTSTDFEPFDATEFLLPMCNDNSEEGWKCTCGTSLSIIGEDEVLIDGSQILTANAISSAISMLDSTDCEKINAFAILGGVVDFNRIRTGVYTSIIMDNSPKQVFDSLKNIPQWSTDSKFKVWKDLSRQKSSSFRRQTTSFNYMGGFHLSHPDKGVKNKRSHLSYYPLDPIQETVFVHNAALVKLLKEADEVAVVFLSPDAAFSLRTSASSCFDKESPGTGFSENACLLAPDDGDDRHFYWKNRSRCTCSRYENCRSTTEEDSATLTLPSKLRSSSSVKSSKAKKVLLSEKLQYDPCNDAVICVVSNEGTVGVIDVSVAVTSPLSNALRANAIMQYHRSWRSKNVSAFPYEFAEYCNANINTILQSYGDRK